MTNHDLLIVIAGLLFVSCITLVLLVYRLRPASQERIANTIRAAFDDVTKASTAHLQANAVLALVDQFVARPEVAANLAEYSRQLVAAAITTRINATAADIKTVSQQLSAERKDVAAGYSSHRPRVKECEAMLEHLQQQLNALYELGQNFGLPRMVALD